jgi:hypothetical protein
MVSGAINEAEFLTAKWSQISLNLTDMVKEATIAQTSTMQDVKKSTFQYIKNHLLVLRESWEKVTQIFFFLLPLLNN